VDKKLTKAETCAEVYRHYFLPGEVCEIRAYGLSRSNKAWEGWAGGNGIVYGYFNNPEDFGLCAAALDDAKAEGIYFTLNPVTPDALARAVNRLKASGPKTVCTQDKEIRIIRWLPVDIDPVRLSGISSTTDELKSALGLRNKIIQWVETNYKWDQWIAACSGNGSHVTFRLPQDQPNTPETTEKIKRALVAISKAFTNAQNQVDLIVYNPSHIWKLYGTVARKGDHTEIRPHRRSYIQKVHLR